MGFLKVYIRFSLQLHYYLFLVQPEVLKKRLTFSNNFYSESCKE
jgi:hypothetical protein